MEIINNFLTTMSASACWMKQYNLAAGQLVGELTTGLVAVVAKIDSCNSSSSFGSIFVGMGLHLTSLKPQ